MIKPLVVWFSFVMMILGGCASATPREPRQCSMHHEPMTSELVVLRNGNASWEYQEAREKHFPYSGTVYTGNILPSTQQQIAQAYICPLCRKTEQKWFRGDFNPNEMDKPQGQTSGSPGDATHPATQPQAAPEAK